MSCPPQNDLPMVGHGTLGGLLSGISEGHKSLGSNDDRSISHYHPGYYTGIVTDQVLVVGLSTFVRLAHNPDPSRIQTRRGSPRHLGV